MNNGKGKSSEELLKCKKMKECKVDSKKFEDIFKFDECKKDSEKGKIYKLKVSKLKPTQNAVGFDEIMAKMEKIRKKLVKMIC